MNKTLTKLPFIGWMAYCSSESVCCNWFTQETCYPEDGSDAYCANITAGGCPCPSGEEKCGGDGVYWYELTLDVLMFMLHGSLIDDTIFLFLNFLILEGLVSALPFAAGMMKKHATTTVGTPLHAPPSIKVDALVPKARRNAGASMAFQDFVPSFAAGMMRKRATTMLENRTLALPSMMVDAHAPKAKQNAQEHLVGLDIAPHFAVRNSLVTILIPGNQNPVRLGKKDVPLIPSMHLTW